MINLERLPRDTTTRLRAVIEAITNEPDKFDMGYWVDGAGESGHFKQSQLDIFGEPRPASMAATKIDCNTTCCIAGWAVALTPKDAFPHKGNCWTVYGRELLGLGPAADSLFAAAYLQRKQILEILQGLAEMDEHDRAGKEGDDFIYTKLEEFNEDLDA